MRNSYETCANGNRNTRNFRNTYVAPNRRIPLCISKESYKDPCFGTFRHVSVCCRVSASVSLSQQSCFGTVSEVSALRQYQNVLILPQRETCLFLYLFRVLLPVSMCFHLLRTAVSSPSKQRRNTRNTNPATVSIRPKREKLQSKKKKMDTSRAYTTSLKHHGPD